MAIDEIDALKLDIEDARQEAGIPDMEESLAKLKEQVDEYVIEHGEIEHEKYKLTRVQGYRRKWNVTKLEKILPRAVFRKVVKVEVDSDKLDDAVRAGNIDRKKIRAAYEETPNKPYAKWTAKKDDKPKADAEADSLAAKLG